MFYEQLEPTVDEIKPNHLIVAISSDKGLCGGVHSAIGKAIKAEMADKAADSNVKMVSVGDKARGILSRYEKYRWILLYFVWSLISFIRIHRSIKQWDVAISHIYFMAYSPRPDRYNIEYNLCHENIEGLFLSTWLVLSSSVTQNYQ